jgi:hypothetical protein
MAMPARNSRVEWLVIWGPLSKDGQQQRHLPVIGQRVDLVSVAAGQRGP